MHALNIPRREQEKRGCCVARVLRFVALLEKLAKLGTHTRIHMPDSHTNIYIHTPIELHSSIPVLRVYVFRMTADKCRLHVKIRLLFISYRVSLVTRSDNTIRRSDDISLSFFFSSYIIEFEYTILYTYID